MDRFIGQSKHIEVYVHLKCPLEFIGCQSNTSDHQPTNSSLTGCGSENLVLSNDLIKVELPL